jgi:mRNA interferase MazF
MTNFKRGDVVLVDIAFSGTVGYKRRPSVVISVETFNRAGVKLVVAAITGNVSPPFRPGDTLLNDWKAAGLLKPSAVRGVLATVDKSDVARKLGSLSSGDMSKVDMVSLEYSASKLCRRHRLPRTSCGQLYTLLQTTPSLRAEVRLADADCDELHATRLDCAPTDDYNDARASIAAGRPSSENLDWWL